MKKVFRRITGITVAALLMVSMAGCGNGNGGNNTEATENTEEAVVEEQEEPQETIAKVEEVEGNLMKNGFFSDDDVSMWSIESGASKISIGSDSAEAAEGYPTYGIIDRDASTSSPYDCFAQDVTDTLKSGVTYNYEFYAKLSSDYEGAPADQRVVDFAPYITVGGQTNYLGSYSSEITGNPSNTLEPGEWTKFSGTFTPMFDGTAEKAVIRIIEQGTDYGNGVCVKGDYYLAGVKLVPEGGAEGGEENAMGVEEDIQNLRDVLASADGLGDDAICGTCLGSVGVNDGNLMKLVEKHFNAVTLENELKMDSMFGYNNDSVPAGSVHEEELNGEKIMVPTLDNSRADAILDKIVEWNSSNPDKQIRVRGHVLVWHSQAPEWFFHEDYDKSNDYVSQEEMDKRLEWYIKSVLEYYTGENSKYKGLFYGWDVVNEAISDSTGTYRTDTEPGSDQLSDSTHGSKSSWWKVYGSNEFIINAFKYANKYAPADLELYYNDYNECDSNKLKGIVQLLEDVKAGEDTRISGFGMQGHYTVNAPSSGQIEDAVRAYSEVVDKVMLTELDVKVSPMFDGTEEALPDEYARQAAYYSSIYELLKKLDKEEGINVSGITIWGVIDTYSWLQQQSNVGGGATGKILQCPLLFDGKYKAKPAFWALVDPSTVDASILEVKRPTIEIKKGTASIGEDIDSAWDEVEAIPLDIKVQGTEATCEAKLLWDEENLYVLFDVKDKVLNDSSEDDYQQDSIEVFIDETNSRAGSYDAGDKQYRVSFNNKLSFNGEKCLEEYITSSAKTTDDGYIVTAAIKWSEITPEAGTEIGLELQINDAGSDGTRRGTMSWADDTGTCYMNPSMFGHAVLVE
ncbi:Endo-1,4-beta-xylanase, GH35 family [Lachnospiraceae bacterium]|nr:Endo-1,4-beta-xylanase, GH35 family [Lachnospiraceae bacterium]